MGAEAFVELLGALAWAGPLLVLGLLLARRRYVGEDVLARLRDARGPRRRRRRPATVPSPPGAPRLLARGGRLLGAAIAVRPPPSALRGAR